MIVTHTADVAAVRWRVEKVIYSPITRRSRDHSFQFQINISQVPTEAKITVSDSPNESAAKFPVTH